MVQQAQNKKFIFIHIPKTGGTTLRAVFGSQYKGQSWYHQDSKVKDNTCYDKESFVCLPTEAKWLQWLKVNHNSSVHLVELHVDVKSGHCLPKDLLATQRQKLYSKFNWLTIFRDPVQKLISEYYFFMQPNELFPYWKHLNPDNHSLKEFGTRFTNSHIKYFLGRQFIDHEPVTEKDLQRVIDFIDRNQMCIGILEEWKKSLDYFEHYFGNKLTYTKNMDHRINKREQLISDKVLKLIRQHNQLDYLLYDRYKEKLLDWHQTKQEAKSEGN